MARRIESRVGIPGVRVVDSDTGAQDLLRGTRVLAGQVAETAFAGLANVRQAQAVSAARNADLTRDERGNLISPASTADKAFPSIYSTTYDQIMQKRFLNELGLSAAEKLADYHNKFKLDPEGFRNATDAYIEETLSNVSDEAYEPARSVLQTFASQHFTDIANKRAQRDFEDSQAVTSEVLSRLIYDAHRNAAADGVDDEARAAEDGRIMANLEAELQFATQPGVDQLSVAEANAIRDQAARMTTIGQLQRGSKSIFAQAEEVADVEQLISEATLQAEALLTPETEELLGGPGRARELIQQSIQMVGYERAVQLAGRDMREAWRINDTVRGIQARQAQAIASGDYRAYIAALSDIDPTSFRDPTKRGSMLQLMAAGEGLSSDMTQSAIVLDSLALAAERAAAEYPDQIMALATRFGVPWDQENGTASFPVDSLMSPDGLSEAITRMRAMLGGVEEQTGQMSTDQSEVAQHWQRVMTVLGGVIERRGEDMEDLQKRIAAGDESANITMQNIWAEVDNAIRPHKYTKANREAMDEVFVVDLLAKGLGVDPAEMAPNAPHGFELAMQVSPQLAGQLIEYYKGMGGLSESGMRFLHTTGAQVRNGTELVPDETLGAAMMLYGVLKSEPMAAENADLPPAIEAGFERLWSGGFRGVFGQDGFKLAGGAAVGAQQVFAGESETAERDRLLALGLDPKEYGSGKIAEVVSEKLHPRFFGSAIAYPDYLPGQVQRHIERMGPNADSPEAVVKELRKTDFEALGYGRTSMVATPWAQGDRSWLAQNAPASVYRNENMRRNPERYEAMARQVLAEDFAHIPGLAEQGQRIMLTGIEEQEWQYNDPNGIVSNVPYTAMAFVIDDDGQMRQLHDKDGNLTFISLNDLMKRAWQRATEQDKVARKNMTSYYRGMGP